MATMYALPALTNWNNGSGGWSNTSGGVSNGTFPGSYDTAIFDANSGPARSIPVSAGVSVGTTICTGAKMSLTGTSYLLCYGSNAVAITHDFSGFASIAMLQIAGAYPNRLITGPCAIGTALLSGSVVLSGSLTVSGTIYIGDSNFDANGYNVTCAYLTDSGTGTAPTVYMRDGVWTFTGVGGLVTNPYFGISPGSCTVVINNSSASAKSFFPGYLTSSNTLWVQSTGTGALNITGSFNIGTFRVDAGNVVLAGGTQVTANLWKVAGTPSSYVSLSSSVAGQYAVISSFDSVTKFYFDYCKFKDITTSGRTNFIARSSINNGNTVGIIFFKTMPNFMSFF